MKKKPDELVSQAEFAMRVGVVRSMVGKYIHRGMPLVNGLVPFKASLNGWNGGMSPSAAGISSPAIQSMLSENTATALKNQGIAVSSHEVSMSSHHALVANDKENLWK